MKFLVGVFFVGVYFAANCGREVGGALCGNNPSGSCCSSYGFCGSSAAHCDVSKGCQSGCTTSQYSRNEKCGINNGLMCDPLGSFGPCCSKSGYCGSSPAYCAPANCVSGCQAAGVSKCGDGFCDKRTETCASCASDCGRCNVPYIDKCVSPGSVALTFDDGPDNFADDLLVKAQALNVKLTFFVIGAKLASQRNRDALLRYYRAGHTVASHTFTHPFMTQLSDEQLRLEMRQTDDAIFNLIGQRPALMRNPYADTNERVQALIQSMGYISIFTSIDTQDTVFGLKGPQRIFTNVLAGLQPASPTRDRFIVTQHETYNQSIAFLPQIVNELRNSDLFRKRTLLRNRRYSIPSIQVCLAIPSPYRSDQCGDGKCTGYIENCSTCPADCGRCP